MPEDRTKFMIRMSPETQEQIRRLYKQDNCKSQNEFIEKAIQFYSSYVTAKGSAPFLTQTLTSTLQGMLDERENQNARMLFKLAVEIDMMMHILAVSYEIDDSYLRILRGRCVEEVRRSNGTFSLEKAAQTEQQKSTAN